MQGLENKVEELEHLLAESEEQVLALGVAAQAEGDLEEAQEEADNLCARIKVRRHRSYGRGHGI